MGQKPLLWEKNFRSYANISKFLPKEVQEPCTSCISGTFRHSLPMIRQKAKSANFGHLIVVFHLKPKCHVLTSSLSIEPLRGKRNFLINSMMKTTKRNVIFQMKFDYDNSRILRHIVEYKNGYVVGFWNCHNQV